MIVAFSRSKSPRLEMSREQTMPRLGMCGVRSVERREATRGSWEKVKSMGE